MQNNSALASTLSPYATSCIMMLVVSFLSLCQDMLMFFHTVYLFFFPHFPLSMCSLSPQSVTLSTPAVLDCNRLGWWIRVRAGGVILFLFHQKMSGGHNTGLHTGRLPKEGATEVHTHVGEKDSDCYQVERSLSAYTRRRPGDVCLCLARRLLALSTVAGGAHFSIYKKTLCVGSREEVLSSYLGSLAEALSYSIYCPCSNK